MEDLIEDHTTTIGVFSTSPNNWQEHKLCWCLVNHLFGTYDLTEEIIDEGIDNEGFKKRDLHCFYLTHPDPNLPVHRLLSRVLGKDIRGPVFLRYEDHNTNSREILDTLISIP